MYEFKNAWNVLMLYLWFISNKAFEGLSSTQLNWILLNEKIILDLNKVIEIFNKFEQQKIWKNHTWDICIFENE